VPREPGKRKSKKPKPRRLPEREDALKINLPFEDALGAALETRPPTEEKPAPKKKRRKT
jgi:hypothetical protein